ncbi:modifier of mdg4 isoform X5 [Musca domestica]|uniref:Modifier of mdg4 isoform X5 n=1 Tax=Musca domestica TaxID=7370 RepID=A0A9J7I0U0_MUSDO|nr:modifier of mdg4 isoform X5 [Musca domestica]
MADDEQFSLCWNNFNSNLSAGFHESLCRGDLVDVTLAAEGQFVKAHRLVLSVCSPYFRKMFTQMPANQHAFVFLKDVSHTALKDLIQFMYCGEVNVKQEALPAFISTAEALQIKGLTDSDPPQSQTPPEPSTPTPQIQPQQIQNPARVRQRTSTARSYKIETVDDSGDDTKQTTQIVIQTTAPTHPPQATITTQAPQQQHHHHHQQQQQPPQQQHIQQPMQTQTHQLTSVSLPTATTTTAVVSHKRPAQRTNLGSVPHIKRTKSTIDPLEATDASVATQQINVQGTLVTSDVTKSQAQQHHHQQQQQQTQSHHHHQQSQPQQQSNEPEYIDLPIELPTKSEPDYVEDAGDVDQGEQDGNYVEDESYGDMRYDESYFTEGEDGAATGGNASTGGTTNAGATATTSKAIVKSQPLSDSSYMDTTGDQGNSDAQVVLPNDVVPNPEDVLIFFTQSLRGRPAIMANGVRFLIMSENKKKILWRCSSMATKKIKCPARITMLKESPPKFIINKAEHVHAELKRNKYGSTKHQINSVPASKVKKFDFDGLIKVINPLAVRKKKDAPKQQQHDRRQSHHHEMEEDDEDEVDDDEDDEYQE